MPSDGLADIRLTVLIFENKDLYLHFQSKPLKNL